MTTLAAHVDRDKDRHVVHDLCDGLVSITNYRNGLAATIRTPVDDFVNVWSVSLRELQKYQPAYAADKSRADTYFSVTRCDKYFSLTVCDRDQSTKITVFLEHSYVEKFFCSLRDSLGRVQ